MFIIVVVVNCHAKAVTLSWDSSPTQSVVGYLVLTSLNSTMESPSQQDVSNVLSYTANGLDDNGSHWFCVKAYDGEGNQSECSNIVHSPPALLDLDFEVNVELLGQ